MNCLFVEHLWPHVDCLSFFVGHRFPHDYRSHVHRIPPRPPREARHYRKRLMVGPKSVELFFDILRHLQAGVADDAKVVLKIKSRDGKSALELTPYGYKDGSYYFSLEGEFMTDAEKWPKGLYRAEVWAGECKVDELEIVKAPSYWTSHAGVGHDPCIDTNNWAEPACKKVEPTRPPKPTRGRPPCCPKRVYATSTPTKDYVSDLSSLFEDLDEEGD